MFKGDKKTKKNITLNPSLSKKKNDKNERNEKSNKTEKSNSEDFIQSLLNKKKSSFVKSAQKTNSNQKSSRKKDRMINNFHKAINSTKSDEIIIKMLELKEDDIISFYSNLENLIGKEMSEQIKEQMSEDLKKNSKLKDKYEKNFALCPFCCENKSNCVILLCGHMLCNKCGKNINRCKYPCPKCKKPIKYIQYITE